MVAATRKEQQFQSRVLPGPETTVNLFGKLRSVRGESGPGKLPIGKYTKFPFQRVFTCLIRTSYEKITSVSNSELQSVRESAIFCRGTKIRNFLCRSRIKLERSFGCSLSTEMGSSSPICMMERSNDLFLDYTNIKAGKAYDREQLSWKLESSATYAGFLSWESDMVRGFARCRANSQAFGSYTEYVLASRRVDVTVAGWWRNEKYAKDMRDSECNWEMFREFLRSRFLEKSMEMDKVVIPEDVEPLSGLNMQLKRVHADACKTGDKGQRWSLFQTQCIIKGKECKLMIDGGSCTNGISKAMVAALGLSTWRIPEPKHLEWLNSCGMLKVTHKVRVPFIVGDYVDEVECDVLPLEVCGLLLGRPWQYDRNVIHAGRSNIYFFVHNGKQQTLKPMKDDQIKSDIELVVQKEKLRKAKPPRLAKVEHEEHDAQSDSADIASATPEDDKPVVLVSDKPVEVNF